MGLRANAFATIKEVDNKGNYTVCKITISRKDKNRNNVWYNSFTGYATFVGKAHLLHPMKDQRIKILDFEVTNGYLDFNGEQKWNNTPKVAIFDYELQDNQNTSSPTFSVSPAANFETLDDSSDLPF